MTPSLRAGRPIWLPRDAARSSSTFSRLVGDRQTEVAIVGGGMTGALVASLFTRAGIAVAVLEESRVGRGSTAASSALLLQETDEGMAQLARRYGLPAARRIWHLSRDAVRDFSRHVRRLRIDCDLTASDAIHYATDADGVARLRDDQRLRAAAGLDVEWLSPRELRQLTAIPGRGAILTRGNARFNPYKACMGLIDDAARSGAQIFERSAVRRIVPHRHGVRLHTRTGTLDAARVVIATGYATKYFRRLAGRFRLYRTYVVATRTLREPQRREIGLGDVMVWDAGRPYHYARWTNDHRLLLGGGDRPLRQASRLRLAHAISQLRTDFEAILPALAEVRTETAWEGLFAQTPDTLPYIGPHLRYPRHLFALGYGGNGMTFSFLAARLLLEHYQGVKSPDHRLFAFGRFR